MFTVTAKEYSSSIQLHFFINQITISKDLLAKEVYMCGIKTWIASCAKKMPQLEK